MKVPQHYCKQPYKIFHHTLHKVLNVYWPDWHQVLKWSQVARADIKHQPPTSNVLRRQMSVIKLLGTCKSCDHKPAGSCITWPLISSTHDLMQVQVPGIHYLIRLNLWLGFHGDDALFLHQHDCGLLLHSSWLVPDYLQPCMHNWQVGRSRRSIVLHTPNSWKKFLYF